MERTSRENTRNRRTPVDRRTMARRRREAEANIDITSYEAIMDRALELLSLTDLVTYLARIGSFAICNILEISRPKVIVSRETDFGCYDPISNTVCIGFRGGSLSNMESFEDFAEIVAHETRHKWQFDTGMFSIDDEYIPASVDYQAYKNQPIEVDAFEYGEAAKKALAKYMLNTLHKALLKKGL